MEWNKVIKFTTKFMKIFNLIIYLVLAIIIANTTNLISDSQGAREFLEKIPQLPSKPIFVVVYVVVTYFLLIITMWGMRKYENQKMFLIGLGFVEIILCFTLMYMVNMSYSGIILVVIADFLSYSKHKSKNAVLLSIMLSIYILCDYDFVSLKFDVISFSQYLTYYNKSIQNYLLGLKSMAISINIMIFIVYMIILIRIQSDENKRISILNRKLNNANDELSLMNIKLKEYADTNEKMIETKERNRLAREIHDTVGHNLTGIIAGLDACYTMIDYSPKEVKNQIKIINDVARRGIKEIRRSVKALRPDVLENLSFEDAIKRMIDDISKTAKVNVVFENLINNIKFDSAEEDAIYRVIQEGLTNSIRHGKATEIVIRLFIDKKNINLILCDNGRGCENINSGFGLYNIKERISALKGQVEYRGEEGFTIIAKIPAK